MSAPFVSASTEARLKRNQEALAAMRAYAPIVAAATATVVHGSLADRQSTLPTHDYFGFLGMMMALGLALVIASEAARWHRPWIRHNGPLMAGAILVVGLWDFVTLKMAWLPLPYFPGPDRVLRAMWEDRDLLETSTFHSLRLLLCGYSVGVAAGLVCGVLIGWFRAVRYWGMPALKFIGPIPATAYVPLVMVMFSNAFLSSVALIAMAVWFPVTMLTTSGIANVPLSYLDVARTLGAGRGYLIFRVALPAALPSIFLGLFMGLGAAFLTLIVAETLGVSSGLGWYLKWKQGYLEYAHVYAALVIMAAFFSGLMTILFRVRDRVLGWQKGVIRW